MPIPPGSLEYSFSKPSCSASGVSWTGFELDQAIGEVADSILHDDPARARLERVSAGLHEAGFDRTGVLEFFARVPPQESWRIGETIGRMYLTDHRACSFPWPADWDMKNIHSSPQGADLVGFWMDGSSARFAFGEVKTSTDSGCPPRVMRGSDGLVQQIRTLCDSKSVRDSLIRYLARRVEDPQWCAQLKSALGRYL